MVKSKIVTAKVHGWEGEGPTVKVAKENAVKASETAAKGHYTPMTIHHRGMFGVIFREPEGWCYLLLSPGEQPNYPCVHTSPDRRKDRAEEDCRAHLAQNGWAPADGDDVPDPMTTGCSPERVKDQVYWQRWQLDYRRLKALGKTDDQAHREASGSLPVPQTDAA